MKSKKVRKLRGSVLFTTLTVLFVMLVLVLTTIALAGAASRRAYSNWYDNQTNYTAQSLVDGVIESFKEGQENDDLGQSIVQNLGSVGDEVTVNVTDETGSSYISGYGRVNSIKFKYVGDNSDAGKVNDYFISGLSDDKKNQKIIKVTAEVTMNGKTSTYSKYVIGNYESDGSGGTGPGGFNSFAENKSGEGSNDAPNTYGKIYSGILKPMAGYNFSNQSKMAGDIFVNLVNGGKFSNNSNVNGDALTFGRNDPYNNCYSGLRAEGDIEFKDGTIVVRSYYGGPGNLNVQANDSVNNIPYIYAKNQFKIGGGGTFKVEGGALNIFCETVDIGGNGATGNFNLICLGTGNSVINSNSTNLTRWVEGVVTPAPADPEPETPAVTEPDSPVVDEPEENGSDENVTDENGSDEAVNEENGVAEAQEFPVPSPAPTAPAGSKMSTGNIYCAGNLTLPGGYTVNGDLYVGGNLTYSNGLTVKGTVYVAGNKSGNGTITGNTDADAVNKLKADFEDIKKAKKKMNGSTNEVNVFQTIENIKLSYKPQIETDASGNIIKTVITGSRNSSKQGLNAGSTNPGVNIKDDAVEKNGVYVLEGNSFIFGSETKKFFGSGATNAPVYIKPAENKVINIDFTKDFDNVSMSEIIIDDTYGVDVFINGSKLVLNKSLILTTTYCKMFRPATFTKIAGAVALGNKYDSYTAVSDSNPLKLQTFYNKGDNMVPKITFYSAPGNKLDVEIQNAALVTGDFVCPDGHISKKAQDDLTKIAKIEYKYMTATSKGTVVAGNGYTLTDTSKDLSVIGSLAFKEIDTTNYFGYYYVDALQGDGDDNLDNNGRYLWADIDGYANY